MGRRKQKTRLMKDHGRMTAIAEMVGLEAWQFQDTLEFRRWVRATTPQRLFEERTYAAMLFVEDLVLAISIAERTNGIREAGREAKAVAALKEIANA